jgi:Flp pilus assembly secretin CpaC
MENILLIEDILAERHNTIRELMGKQVEIETKFVEVNQSMLNELGFDWNFDSKNDGAANIFENLVFPKDQSLLANTLRTSSQALNSGVNPATLSVTKGAGSLQWNLVISALEQSDDTDVLSAPRVVTRDGNTATIQVGEERMVPKRFGVNSANTSIYVEHSDWDSELMGVQLEVTPELRSGDLIDLELKPKVMELVGYDDYQVSPDNAVMWPIQGQAYQNAHMPGRYPIVTGYIGETGTLVTNTVGKLYQEILNSTDFLGLTYRDGTSNITVTNAPDVNDWSVQKPNQNGLGASWGFFDARRKWSKEELIDLPSLHGALPYFRIREMETMVTVADGSTVGMGGLIYNKLETYKDKVPVLGSIPLIGRLFRSEGERSIKRNLLIFVTAAQVDINGRLASDQ